MLYYAVERQFICHHQYVIVPHSPHPDIICLLNLCQFARFKKKTFFLKYWVYVFYILCIFSIYELCIIFIVCPVIMFVHLFLNNMRELFNISLVYLYFMIFFLAIESLRFLCNNILVIFYAFWVKLPCF